MDRSCLCTTSIIIIRFTNGHQNCDFGAMRGRTLTGRPCRKMAPASFDVTFLRFSLMQILMFYELQCSKAYFLETIVPNLKNSLSLALNHFSPLAGNTTLPLTSGTPFTHYVAGDSVSLTIAQSDADFVHLTGNHYRYSPISNYFYFLVVNKDYYFIFRQ